MLKLHSRPTDEPSPLFTPELILRHAGAATARSTATMAAALHRRPGRGEPRAPRRGARRQPAGVAVPAALRRARALLDGRHYFTHEDVQAIALGVLGHRLIIRPEAEVEGKHVADIVSDLLNTVPVMETK